MNDKKVSSLQDILKEILANDINLLNSRNELIDKVKAQISGNNIREFSAIQKALQNNVGELFLKATFENTPEAKEETKIKVREMLHQQNLQEKRIQMVIDTFVYALDWNRQAKILSKKVVKKNIIPVKIIDINKPLSEPTPSKSNIIKKPIINEDNSWICSCGNINYQPQCTNCGQICTIAELLKLAISENAEAQNLIAVHYEEGINIEQNLNKAFYWYEKSAEQGFALAQYHLAIFYEMGISVQKDPYKAFYWCNKAVEQNLAVAQNKLGLFYEAGFGVDKNEYAAVKLYQKSAEQNFNWAQYNLALCYDNGSNGLKQDKEKAFYWCHEAAKNNLPKAQYILGIYYDKGFGTLPNRSEAIFWMKKAADNNLEEAQIQLKEYYNERLQAANAIENTSQIKQGNDNSLVYGCLIYLIFFIIVCFIFSISDAIYTAIIILIYLILNGLNR